MTDDLKIWFSNIQHNLVNNDILLFCVQDKKINIEIEKFINSSNMNIQIVQLHKLTKEMMNSKNAGQKNIIAYCHKEFSLGHLGILKSENSRIILMELVHFQQFVDYFYNKQTMNQNFWIMQKQDTTSIISSLDGIQFIHTFISKFITGNANQCKINKKSVELFLYRKASITIETILGDIDFLVNKSILTSRLAIFIYKICTFDYDASDKEIGLYFSKHYGRSKVINNKKFGVINTKGYATQLNMHDQQIQLDIAIKLEKRGVTKDIIAFATGVNLQ